jgi:hypothetical protein
MPIVQDRHELFYKKNGGILGLTESVLEHGKDVREVVPPSSG